MTKPAEPIDLAAIAAAHPVRHVRLDLTTFDLRETLTIQDVVDMAAALDVPPDELESRLAPGGRLSPSKALDVGVVLAWIIGRKGDPDLTLATVRTTWQVELGGVGTANPTTARARRPRSRGQATSSPSRK